MKIISGRKKLSKTIKNKSYLLIFLVGALAAGSVGVPYYVFKALSNLSVSVSKYRESPPSLHDIKTYAYEAISILPFGNNIPRLDLNIKMNDSLLLECKRQLLHQKKYPGKVTKENCKLINPQKNAKAVLTVEGEKFKVKVSPKGDRPIHFENPENFSLKLDIRGDKRLWGMEEFSLQEPIIRNYTSEAIASKVFRENGIISGKHYYVDLFINGKYMGIKHLEQLISPELIESTKHRYGPILSLNEDKGVDYSENTEFELQDKKYWDSNNTEIAANILFGMNHTQASPDRAYSLMDKSQWSKYFAITDLLETYHGSLAKSVKFYLNPVSGKVEPIFYDGHKMNKLDDFLFSDLVMGDENKNCGWICKYKPYYSIFWGNKLSPRDEFVVSYIKSMDSLLSTESTDKINKVIKNYAKIRGKLYRQSHKADLVYTHSIFPHIFLGDRQVARIKKLKQLMDKSKKSTPKVYSKNSKFLISNLISRFPQILYFRCGEMKWEPMILAQHSSIKLDSTLDFQCDNDRLEISIFNDQNFRNLHSLATEKLNPNFALLLGPQSIRNLNLKLSPVKPPQVYKDKAKIYIDKSSIFKDQTIKVEGDLSFIISNDANLRFKNVIIKGKPGSKVSFIGKDTKASDILNGSVIIEDSQLDIGELVASNLNAPKIALQSLYAGVNFINSAIKLNSLFINNSRSEDGLNVIDSNLNVKFADFSNIQSDALDSDFSDFNIYNMVCSNVGNDCLDVSFSNGGINKLEAYSTADKAVSVGEASKISFNSLKIDKAEIGLVAKDASTVSVNRIIITKTKVPIALYVKKPEFGVPSISISSKVSQDLMDKSLISFDSSLIIDNKKTRGLYTSSEINNKLYGNEFGVKTVR